MDGLQAALRPRTSGGGRLWTFAASSFRTLVWGYAAGVCLVAVVLWLGADRWWPATVLLFGPRWVLGVPFMVLAPIALATRPRLARVLAVAALVYLFPVLGLNLGMSSRPTADDVTVVTLNVADGTRLDAPLGELVALWDADVVALQECPPGLFAAAQSVEGRFVHNTGGLCLLSRYPIRRIHPMERGGFEAAGGSGWVVRYELEGPGGHPFHLTNVHLATPRRGLHQIRYGEVRSGIRSLRQSTDIRRSEARAAREVVGAARGPSIAVGDFNTPVESTIYRRFWGDMINAFDRAGVGLGHTRYNGWIRARIDHVLVNEDWSVVDAWIGASVGSDHRPVFAVLRPRRS